MLNTDSIKAQASSFITLMIRRPWINCLCMQKISGVDGDWFLCTCGVIIITARNPLIKLIFLNRGGLTPPPPGRDPKYLDALVHPPFSYQFWCCESRPGSNWGYELLLWIIFQIINLDRCFHRYVTTAYICI